jgi:hypothetical protein
MNFTVADFARIAPFSPVKYIWFDLSDVNALKKKYSTFADGSRFVDKTPNNFIQDIPMPFDNMALILSVLDDIDREVRIVMSVERTDNNLMINEWSTKYKKPIASLTINERLHNKPTPAFNPDYLQEMMKRGVPSSAVASQLQKLMNYVFPIFACLCYHKPEDGEPLMGYFCTDDNPSNAKRIKKGKRPLFEWTTVTIRDDKGVPTQPQGGTHASPKPHDRRGHQRRLKSGKVIYIRSMTINKHKIPQEGFIHHDYKVTA